MIFFVKRFLYHESSLSLSLSFFLSLCCLLVCIVLFFVLFNCLVCCWCCCCFVIYLLFLVVIKPGLEGTAYMHAQKKKLIDPLSKFRVINFLFSCWMSSTNGMIWIFVVFVVLIELVCWILKVFSFYPSHFAFSYHCFVSIFLAAFFNLFDSVQ